MWPKFPRKLHENERDLLAPLDPLMKVSGPKFPSKTYQTATLNGMTTGSYSYSWVIIP